MEELQPQSDADATPRETAATTFRTLLTVLARLGYNLIKHVQMIQWQTSSGDAATKQEFSPEYK
jgi:hypothetical protein